MMNTPQTWHDPVVEEIHAIREQLAKQYDNDLAAYSRAADEHRRALGFPIADPYEVYRDVAAGPCPRGRGDRVSEN